MFNIVLFKENLENAILRFLNILMFNNALFKVVNKFLQQILENQSKRNGIHEVTTIAGHSNIHTTLRYINPSEHKLHEKMNWL